MESSLAASIQMGTRNWCSMKLPAGRPIFPGWLDGYLWGADGHGHAVMHWGSGSFRVFSEPALLALPGCWVMCPKQPHPVLE